ncbi:TldD/PmbA family protein [Archaeoglobales archaeon]|nr:MAG: TldD/PmbA family protein [Archaeoglobales archaeon]
MVQFYDIREVSSESLSINLENDIVEKPKYDLSMSKGFRVLKNGFWGLFFGNADDKVGLKLAEKNVVSKGDAEVVNVKSEGKFLFKAKINPKDVDIEEKINLLKEIEGVLKSSKIVSTRIAYLENVRKFSYKDSNGSEVYYEVPRIGVIIHAFAKGETLQFYSKRLLKVGGFEVFNNKPFELAEEVKDVLNKLVNAKTPPSGEMNVIMDSSLAGVFIHEAFGHAVEADHVLQNSSVVADRLNTKVADESVNVYDDPSIQEFGFYSFDDEGVKAEKKAIIENGILKSFLHSKETASKLNGKAGNARAQGVDEPLVRMSNTYIDEGNYTFDELLENAEIYLIGSRGGETNPATGYFHFNAQYGYIVKNGEIAEMIRDVSLSGNTLKILHSIKVGKGVKFDPGFCGKAGQLVPVADGAPPSLVKAFVGGA